MQTQVHRRIDFFATVGFRTYGFVLLARGAYVLGKVVSRMPQDLTFHKSTAAIVVIETTRAQT